MSERKEISAENVVQQTLKQGTVSVMGDEVSMQQLFDAIADVSMRSAAWLTAHGR